MEDMDVDYWVEDPRTVESYLDTLLWTDMLDFYDMDVISPDALKQSREDVEGFLRDNWEDIVLYKEARNLSAYDAVSNAMHDFLLTRNRHGAGFWDRGLGELGERLSEAAKAWGSVDAYEGDDGLVYIM